MEDLLGKLVGSYRVTQILGQGGMGAVYLAEHPDIGRKVAIKVLLAEAAARKGLVERFFAEAKAVNLIRHPNIVDVTDISRLPDGRAYLVMEYLEGQSLAKYLADRKALSLQEAAGLALQMADALGAAHARGIVHRDMKPDNVILLARPNDIPFVKILDFGIAKLSVGDGGQATQTGSVMGTPAYMSPEQALGKNNEIDGRTDLYALGVILFQMLAGRPPYESEAFGELMIKHLYEPIPSLIAVRPDLPAELDVFINRVLAKRKDDRFPSMQSLAQELVRICTMAGTPASLPAIPTPHSLQPPTPLPGGELSKAPSMPPGVVGHVSAQLSGPVAIPRPISVVQAPVGQPTTLQGSAGEAGMIGSPRRKKTALVAISGVVAVAAIAVVAAVAVHGSKTSSPDGTAASHPPVASNPPPASAPSGAGSVTTPGAAKTVKLTLSSTPPGATVTVTVDGKAQPSQTTPSSLTAPAGSNVTLTYSLAGYGDAPQTLTPTEDMVVDVAMIKTTVAAQPVAQQAPRPVNNNTKPPVNNQNNAGKPRTDGKSGLVDEKPVGLDF
jgi:serine/threonine-protein kinase